MDNDSSLYESTEIERAIGYYLKALESAGLEPDSPVAPAGLFGQATSELNVRRGGQPSRPAYRLFEQHASSCPDKVAVAAGDLSLSYGELNAKANRLARHLISLGVGYETPVGIMLERTPDMLAALLAIQKAGGVFVPLNTAMPPARLTMIASDCGLTFVVVDRASEEYLPAEAAAAAICADRLDLTSYSPGDLAEEPPLDSVAYIMFTSGSTGRPKGVEITHRSLANVLLSIGEEIGITPADRWMAVTALSFDISLLENLLPLTSGAEILLASASGARDGFYLANLIDSARPTILQATPSMWRLLLEAGWNGRRGLRALCGGEAMPCSLAAELLSRTDLLWNVYGPTETTIWSTIARVVPAAADPPIGGPLANTALYVLDEDGQLVPDGWPGELYIGGVGVARGYRNRPEQTRERFLPDPFAPEPESRMYRTGDRVCRRPDGQLEYLGRIDGQVKIRGYRVELSEIETHLRRHPGVVETVVFLARAQQPDARLTAHVLPAHTTPILAADLRAHLAKVVPPYMIPSEFVMVDSFPLTPNGKVDRVAVASSKHVGSRDEARPDWTGSTAVENAIARIWKDVLQAGSVGPTDNFFDIGGQSLLLMRVAARIQKEFGWELQPLIMFQYPTIRSLAAYLSAQEGRDTVLDNAAPARRMHVSDLAARRKSAWAGVDA